MHTHTATLSTPPVRTTTATAAGIVLLAALSLTVLHSFVLFHTMAEMVSIAVAGGVFIISWCTRTLTRNGYFKLIGVGFLFTSLIDLLHTLSYKGLGMFPGQGADLPTQLWIAGRYMQAATLLLAPLFSGRDLGSMKALAVYGGATAMLLGAIFGGWFPACYIESVGQTPFKIASEYVVSGLLAASAAHHYLRRKRFEPVIIRNLLLAVGLAVVSEMAFTSYAGVYDFSNGLGHLLKIGSFYFIYKAFVEATLTKPLAILFRDLQEREEALRRSEEELRASCEELEVRVAERTRELATGERLLRDVLDALPVGILIADRNGTVARGNPAAREIIRTTEEGTGGTSEAIIRPLAEAVSDGAAAIGREIFIPGGDTGRIIRASCLPVRGEDGAIAAGIAVIEDVTERKRQEESLKLYSEQLLLSNRDLEEFAHVASHDLQEPLRKIQAFGDRLRKAEGDRIGAESLDYLNRIQGASGRMRSLINSLLTYSRVSTSERKVTRVDLQAVVGEVLEDLEERLRETGGRVEADSLPAVVADGFQMRQLFQNLIGNGLKYHRPGVPPVVKVYGRSLPALDGAGADGHAIVVEDNGIGFDDRYLDRIFKPFQRLHGRQDYEGTGIGLAIVRRIVERHGGSITGHSIPGQGTAFTISLPGQQAAGSSSPSQAA